jgi:hypothetical protein
VPEERSAPDDPRLAHGVAAVSWGRDRIDLFWVGSSGDVRSSGELMHRSWDGSAWSTPESLGGNAVGPPAAVAWAENQMEVFAVFPDGRLWDRYWDGQRWHPWESLGGDLVGPPTASSWGADRLDVFAPGRDGRIWHRWWDGTRWVEWEETPAG